MSAIFIIKLFFNRVYFNEKNDLFIFEMVIILSILVFKTIFMCDDLTMMFVFFFLALDIIEYEYNTSATNFVLNLNII